MNAAVIYSVVAIMAGVALAVVQTLRERSRRRANRMALLARLPRAASEGDAAGDSAVVRGPACRAEAGDLSIEDFSMFAERGPEILFEQQVRR